MPDAKRWIEKALLRHHFDKDVDYAAIINETMAAYNQRIEETNTRLGKPYETLPGILQNLVRTG